MQLILETKARPTDQHQRRYNAPQSSEIAVIIPGSGDGTERPNPRDIIIKVEMVIYKE